MIDHAAKLSAITDVKQLVLLTLSAALTTNIAKSSPNTKVIIKQFRTNGVLKIPVMELEAQGLSIDYPVRFFVKWGKMEMFTSFLQLLLWGLSSPKASPMIKA
jgi:hypothetical protein